MINETPEQRAEREERERLELAAQQAEPVAEPEPEPEPEVEPEPEPESEPEPDDEPEPGPEPGGDDGESMADIPDESFLSQNIESEIVEDEAHLAEEGAMIQVGAEAFGMDPSMPSDTHMLRGSHLVEIEPGIFAEDRSSFYQHQMLSAHDAWLRKYMHGLSSAGISMARGALQLLAEGEAAAASGLGYGQYIRDTRRSENLYSWIHALGSLNETLAESIEEDRQVLRRTGGAGLMYLADGLSIVAETALRLKTMQAISGVAYHAASGSTTGLLSKSKALTAAVMSKLPPSYAAPFGKAVEMLNRTPQIAKQLREMDRLAKSGKGALTLQRTYNAAKLAATYTIFAETAEDENGRVDAFWRERTARFMQTWAFMATPAVAGWFGGAKGAFLEKNLPRIVDFALNTSLSVSFGEYTHSQQMAEMEADKLGLQGGKRAWFVATGTMLAPTLTNLYFSWKTIGHKQDRERAEARAAVLRRDMNIIEDVTPEVTRLVGEEALRQFAERVPGEAPKNSAEAMAEAIRVVQNDRAPDPTPALAEAYKQSQRDAYSTVLANGNTAEKLAAQARLEALDRLSPQGVVNEAMVDVGPQGRAELNRVLELMEQRLAVQESQEGVMGVIGPRMAQEIEARADKHETNRAPFRRALDILRAYDGDKPLHEMTREEIAALTDAEGKPMFKGAKGTTVTAVMDSIEKWKASQPAPRPAEPAADVRYQDSRAASLKLWSEYETKAFPFDVDEGTVIGAGISDGPRQIPDSAKKIPHERSYLQVRHPDGSVASYPAWGLHERGVRIVPKGDKDPVGDAMERLFGRAQRSLSEGGPLDRAGANREIDTLAERTGGQRIAGDAEGDNLGAINLHGVPINFRYANVGEGKAGAIRQDAKGWTVFFDPRNGNVTTIRHEAGHAIADMLDPGERGQLKRMGIDLKTDKGQEDFAGKFESEAKLKAFVEDIRGLTPKDQGVVVRAVNKVIDFVNALFGSDIKHVGDAREIERLAENIEDFRVLRQLAEGERGEARPAKVPGLSDAPKPTGAIIGGPDVSGKRTTEFADRWDSADLSRRLQIIKDGRIVPLDTLNNDDAIKAFSMAQAASLEGVLLKARLDDGTISNADLDRWLSLPVDERLASGELLGVANLSSDRLMAMAPSGFRVGGTQAPALDSDARGRLVDPFIRFQDTPDRIAQDMGERDDGKPMLPEDITKLTAAELRSRIDGMSRLIKLVDTYEANLKADRQDKEWIARELDKANSDDEREQIMHKLRIAPRIAARLEGDERQVSPDAARFIKAYDNAISDANIDRVIHDAKLDDLRDLEANRPEDAETLGRWLHWRQASLDARERMADEPRLTPELESIASRLDEMMEKTYQQRAEGQRALGRDMMTREQFYFPMPRKGQKVGPRALRGFYQDLLSGRWASRAVEMVLPSAQQRSTEGGLGVRDAYFYERPYTSLRSYITESLFETYAGRDPKGAEGVKRLSNVINSGDGITARNEALKMDRGEDHDPRMALIGKRLNEAAKMLAGSNARDEAEFSIIPERLIPDLAEVASGFSRPFSFFQSRTENHWTLADILSGEKFHAGVMKLTTYQKLADRIARGVETKQVKANQTREEIMDAIRAIDPYYSNKFVFMGRKDKVFTQIDQVREQVGKAAFDKMSERDILGKLPPPTGVRSAVGSETDVRVYRELLRRGDELHKRQENLEDEKMGNTRLRVQRPFVDQTHKRSFMSALNGIVERVAAWETYGDDIRLMEEMARVMQYKASEDSRQGTYKNVAEYYREWAYSGLLGGMTAFDARMYESMPWLRPVVQWTGMLKANSYLAGSLKFLLGTQWTSLFLVPQQTGLMNALRGTVDALVKGMGDNDHLAVMRAKVGSKETPLNYADSRTPLMKDHDARRYWADLIATPSSWMERFTTLAAMYAAEYAAKERNITSQEIIDHLKNRTAATTQSVYARAGRTLGLHSEITRALFPFQGFSFEAFAALTRIGREYKDPSHLYSSHNAAMYDKLQGAAQFVMGVVLVNAIHGLVFGGEEDQLWPGPKTLAAGKIKPESFIPIFGRRSYRRGTPMYGELAFGPEFYNLYDAGRALVSHKNPQPLLRWGVQHLPAAYGIGGGQVLADAIWEVALPLSNDGRPILNTGAEGPVQIDTSDAFAGTLDVLLVMMGGRKASFSQRKEATLKDAPRRGGAIR